MIQKILILGAGGMLGYAVTEHFRSKKLAVRPMTRREFDISADPFDLFVRELEGVDVVINCAGVIKPLIASTPIEAVLRVNAVFPRNLALACRERSIRCIHITTDCVYSGSRGGYTEKDFFDATDVYGMSKNAGDVVDAMVLRTSIIGEERGTSRSLLEWARGMKGKEVSGFTNHRWNGVTTVCLAETMEVILREDHYKPGIHHIHSPDTVTKLELLELISDVYGLNLKIKAVEAPEAIDRSLASVDPLSSTIVKKKIRQQLEEMATFFQSHRAATEKPA